MIVDIFQAVLGGEIFHLLADLVILVCRIEKIEGEKYRGDDKYYLTTIAFHVIRFVLKSGKLDDLGW